MTTTIKITYGGETVTLTANLVEASAALLVDGNPIGRQTADARHRTADAVRLACIATWPEAGREAWDEGGEAWDAMAYEPADAADANADRWWAWHDQDASRASATMAEADRRCAAWVAGESDDGPDREDVVEVEIAMDTPNGPRVTYGLQDAAEVEAELPEGWSIDWSSAVKLTPPGTQPIRHAAPLVAPPAIHLAISAGTPSDHYPADEQAANGALDYDVTLTIGDTATEGGITLYPDENGKMSTCGTPLDGWCGSTILDAIKALPEQRRRAVIDALACLDDGDVA